MERNRKWYNSKEMVGTLLFIFPPVGIYGVYKSYTITSKAKTIVYIALAIVALFFLFLYFN